MAGPVPGAIPSFVCRFVPAGLREPRIHSNVFRCDVGQVQVISFSGDNGLLCPSVTIYSWLRRGLWSITHTPAGEGEVPAQQVLPLEGPRQSLLFNHLLFSLQ